MIEPNRYGVAFFDEDYTPLIKQEMPKVNGKRVRKISWICPHYAVWMNMITRVYRGKQAYTNVSVCDDWLYFSRFKFWMQTQEWEGKQLDKDLLVEGNKIYSPDTCCFINGKTNVFIINKENINGFTGVVYDKTRNLKPYLAQIKDLNSNKHLNLGRFSTPEEAHLAWKQKKHLFACQLAELEVDVRVKLALTTKYL